MEELYKCNMEDKNNTWEEYEKKRGCAFCKGYGGYRSCQEYEQAKELHEKEHNLVKNNGTKRL